MANELLNNVDHHDLRVDAAHSARFGDAINQVLVFPNEFENVQRDYPIVFRKSTEGPLRPVAILGLAKDENLFLDDNAGWKDGAYVPALLRRGPFALAAPPGGEGDPQIFVDRDHPRIVKEGGEPLFLPQGGNAPYLERTLDALRTLYLGDSLLDPLIAALERADLLRPVNLEVRVSEDALYAISDVRVIDAERLAALGANELDTLHRAGYLQSAFLAAASLGNLQRLADRKGGTPG